MKVAILGFGSIGRRHFKNIRQYFCEHLCIAYDPDPATCEGVRADGLSLTENLNEIWDFNPQVVFVTSPTNFHLDHTRQAVQRNCHVFVEKPVSFSLEGLSEIAAEAKKRALVTMVGCNMRFHPGPCRVKQIVDSKEIGEVLSARIFTGSYLPGWHPERNYTKSYSASGEYGGAILDCIHEIDLALWYFGRARLVASAWKTAESIGLKVDGLAEFLLQHDAGVLSSIHLNFLQRDYRRTNSVIGTQGSVYWDFGRKIVELFDETGRLVKETRQPAEWEINAMYVEEVKHFFDCIAVGRETINPLRGGIQALEVALDARAPEWRL